MSNIEQKKDTRREFIDWLIKKAELDPTIVLIVPDVGFNYIEEFQKKFPERFFNFGVTEQSTTLIAAALALDGWKPYIYSMINFVLFRPYEMVRNGICYHKANVKLIGVKGSSKYKFLGFSHNIVSGKYFEEDFEAIEHLPNIEGFWIRTPEAVAETLEESYESPVASYIRLE